LRKPLNDEQLCTIYLCRHESNRRTNRKRKARFVTADNLWHDPLTHPREMVPSAAGIMLRIYLAKREILEKWRGNKAVIFDTCSPLGAHRERMFG
jgi:hypothetical protein